MAQHYNSYRIDGTAALQVEGESHDFASVIDFPAQPVPYERHPREAVAYHRHRGSQIRQAVCQDPLVAPVVSGRYHKVESNKDNDRLMVGSFGLFSLVVCLLMFL